MKYWLNLFTWKTWQEFMEAGATVSGFTEHRWQTVQKIKPGDIFVCYMTGLSRFFALLEVTGNAYQDTEPIWSEAIFSSRLPVRLIFSLPPEHAVPVIELQGELSYFQNMKASNSWTGHFRGSPLEEKQRDAAIIVTALRDAEQNPVFRPFDERKLERRVPVYKSNNGLVSIPDGTDDSAPQLTLTEQAEADAETTHEEIQWLLLYLGEQMKLDVWVASNDRGKSYQGHEFQSLSRLRKTLPVQFNEATNRTIELIDVLWLQSNTIIAAFEIEHTTTVYSGLLRLADLITMQPNINIPLFIVAPDEREEKVKREINRPIFAQALKRPLPSICRFIPYSALTQKVEQATLGGFLPYLRPDFLDQIAESVELEDK
jgi:hypothetical protein